MVRKSSSQQRKVGSSTSLARNFFSRFDAWLLRRLYNSLGRPQIEIKLGDGISVSPESASPVASFVIEKRRALLQMVLDPELGFGEAYTTGRVRVYGNLVTALERVFRSLQAGETRSWYSRALQRNTSQGARKNIHRHYDLDANFFRLWLDAKLVYSGAYFASSLCTLGEAQIEKMDYICHKINLQPGECVVDIGCGWGALAMHMAKYYRATVKAFSNSHEQILWAGNRAAALGLTHKIEFIEDDYRNIRTQCDALVCVGMLEHVGAEHYREMGRVIKRVLGSTGRGLIQTVGQNQARPFNLWIRKHVFPGTYAPTLRQTHEPFRAGGVCNRRRRKSAASLRANSGTLVGTLREIVRKDRGNVRPRICKAMEIVLGRIGRFFPGRVAAAFSDSVRGNGLPEAPLHARTPL